jgi:hypothetical protein
MATDFEHPDYEALTDVSEIDSLVTKHKESLVTKDFIERRIKEEKKEYNSAINEQLKEVLEERDHEMGVIDALTDRKKRLLATNPVVIPIITAKANP